MEEAQTDTIIGAWWALHAAVRDLGSAMLEDLRNLPKWMGGR